MAKKRVPLDPNESPNDESSPRSTEPSKQRGRPKLPKTKPVLPIAFSVRATQEWTDWFDGLGALLIEGLPVKLDRTQILDVALKEWAASRGFPEPPLRY